MASVFTLDFILWLPMRAPEVLLAAQLAIGGAACTGLFGTSSSFGLALALAGAALATYLRPRQHSLEGYGQLAAGETVPKLTEQGTVRIAGDRFVDEHGRTLLLRGVNLSGQSKQPTQPAAVRGSHTPLAADGGTAFFDHRNVSFVGRPFPLDTADEHFARLRLWGFTFLRLLVTWEAVEHAGTICMRSPCACHSMVLRLPFDAAPIATHLRYDCHRRGAAEHAGVGMRAEEEHPRRPWNILEGNDCICWLQSSSSKAMIASAGCNHHHRRQ